MPNSGKERKARRRSRRQKHHTYDLEKRGIRPEEARLLAASERAAPLPRDGEWLTGPLEYVIQDVQRIRKLKEVGYFTPEEAAELDRKMAQIVERGSPAAPAAYRALHGKLQKDQALELRMLEVELKAYELELKKRGEVGEGGSSHQHIHIHGSGGSADPFAAFMAQMQSAQTVGKEYLEDDPHYQERPEIDASSTAAGNGEFGAGISIDQPNQASEPEPM